jgi:hypothetical protein
LALGKLKKHLREEYSSLDVSYLQRLSADVNSLVDRLSAKLLANHTEEAAEIFGEEKRSRTTRAIRQTKTWSVPVEKNDRILYLQHTACYDEMSADLHAMSTFLAEQIENNTTCGFQVSKKFDAFHLKGDYLRGQLESLTADFLSNLSLA